MLSCHSEFPAVYMYVHVQTHVANLFYHCLSLQRNYQFDFLRPQHSLFNYFTKLVEQYTKVRTRLGLQRDLSCVRVLLQWLHNPIMSSNLVFHFCNNNNNNLLLLHISTALYWSLHQSCINQWYMNKIWIVTLLCLWHM